MEMVELGALGRFLRHPSHQDLYQHSDGLCNPHFAQLLAKADWGVKNFLLADQKRRMERLEQNLWELQRKQSYDVHEAVTEDEAGSWMEAIWRFTGTSWSRLLTRE
jgi:DNA polymerase IIIc chi subunit